MKSNLQELANEIERLAIQLPAEWVIKLASAWGDASVADWLRLRALAANAIPHQSGRDRITAFLDEWQKIAPGASAESVSLALLTAAQAEKQRRQRQLLELVWTGPDSQVIPPRRTDQALLQLINESQTRLTIVSFAVYKAQAIAQALAQAAQRGVAITICLETPEASEGKITFNAIKSFGDETLRRARLYVWPLDQRPQSPDGNHGSLHAKVAVADAKVMLISSANLTEYAMTLNMELGILIHGGELPAQVEEHFGQLIESGVLKKIAHK